MAQDFIVQTEGTNKVDVSPLNRFTNSMGRNYLRALFYETTEGDKSSVVYTLKRRDHLGYPSLYRLYMEACDPTEYRFAVSNLNGWSHWQELVNAPWFQVYLDEWRLELEIKLRSDALASILTLSRLESNPNAYHANKYLLDASWKPKEAGKRGRPTSAQVRAEIMSQAASKAEIEDDAKRMGLQ